MISIFHRAQGYKTAIYSNVNTLHSPILPVRLHFSRMHGAHGLWVPYPPAGGLPMPYFSRGTCIMVPPPRPRFEAVVVINSGPSAASPRPITNLRLHLGPALMHCSSPLMNNSCCLLLGEGRDRQVGRNAWWRRPLAVRTGAGKQKQLMAQRLKDLLAHLHCTNPSSATCTPVVV